MPEINTLLNQENVTIECERNHAQYIAKKLTINCYTLEIHMLAT
jgi:hypothetical protein